MKKNNRFSTDSIDDAIKYAGDSLVEEIRLRAADAYREYQKCGIKTARNLFSTNCSN